ncbi:MAG: hypothetical protein HY051_02960 [Candidatus Aenigmarchaeota archaeon]|nr:hypothetical protein [Candidatus Aenigmarchaeota archaeon]
MTMTIAKQATCGPVERDALIEYLMATPVRWAADLIRGGAQLSKGEVNSREFLGSLETIFENLGGRHPRGVDGRKRFLVREVLPALQDPQCTDKASLERLLLYMKLDAANTLEIKITIVQ